MWLSIKFSQHETLELRCTIPGRLLDDFGIFDLANIYTKKQQKLHVKIRANNVQH